MFCFKYTKKRIVEVLVCLGSPADFLNAIFGIYGKFWIDIGGAKSAKTFFDIYIFSNEFVLMAIVGWTQRMVPMWVEHSVLGTTSSTYAVWTQRWVSWRGFYIFKTKIIGTIFYIENIFSRKFSHLYQSKISRRFQKSHLQNQSVSLSRSKLQLFFILYIWNTGGTHLVTSSDMFREIQRETDSRSQRLP